MSIEIKSYSHADSSKFSICATFDEEITNALNYGDAILKEIVCKVAERYVAENYPVLISKLDQQAIANLVIAESGRKIAEEIKLRPVVLHDTENRVYERGLFGRLRRTV